jgi:cytoskeletal protein RodZ
MAMEAAHFGNLLRQARERRQISLAEVAEQTKVPQWSLQLLEAGNIDDLPADVFVRGFIRSYARSVGIGDSEPLGMFEDALAARRRVEETLAATPSLQVSVGDGPGDDDALVPRRGIGIAVFVIIVLLIATITLSLFLRQPPQSGEGLSMGASPPSAVDSRRLST